MYEIDIFPEGHTLKHVHTMVHWLEENVGDGNPSFIESPDFNIHKWSAVRFNKNNEKQHSYFDNNNKECHIVISSITFQIRDKEDYLSVKMRWG